MPPHFPLRNYGSSSDSEDIVRNNDAWSRQPFIHSSDVPTGSHSHFLSVFSRRSSLSSAANSRSNSPLPQLYPTPHQSSVCPSESDSDSEPRSPLLFDLVTRDPSWRGERRAWWSSPTRRRRRKGWRVTRFFKRWIRWLVRLPFFPSQPTAIVRHLTSSLFYQMY